MVISTALSGVDGLLFPSVEDRVSESTEAWAQDLYGLFGSAKDRFGDVTWECEDGGERIWGHKAVIYARAPKAFKDRYFISKPFSRGPASLRSTSPGPSSHLLPPVFSTRSISPPSSFHQPSPRFGAGSSLSVNSGVSESTIRGRSSEGGILRLAHGDTPELFRAQLEWLYTGEGFGDVVEWISSDAESPTAEGGASIRDSLGRRGNQADRRDKLGQDLTYMWRSKLYADVRIHLDSSTFEATSASGDDSDDSTDSLSSTAIFTSHRFILASRSPYFASVLLNPSSFRPVAADIHLPTPPFTPAALHFCLGYIYAGHLDFSNRTFDLPTAFQIYRAAGYLQLDTLIKEIEARVVHDFCHGLDWDKCHCRKCPLRAAGVWKFASAEDIGAVELAKRARRFVVRAWGECWGKDIGTMEKKEREGILRDVIASIDHRSVLRSFRSIKSIRARMEQGIRTRGKDAAVWVDTLESMVDKVEEHARNVLVDEFTKIAEGKEVWDIISGKGFAGDLLDLVMKELVDTVGTVRGSVEGPKIYQALVSSLLLKVDPDTLQTVLAPRSSARQQVEAAKDGVLAHIRRRWMQIRDSGGFLGLEHWALKELCDEIDVSYDDLVELSISPPKAQRRIPAITNRSSIPRTTSRIASLSEASLTSPRSTVFSARGVTARSTSASAGPSTTTATEANGLRRLRLSSSASTSSVASTRSVQTRPAPAALAGSTSSPLAGPSARSPTAARIGTVVAVGARARANASSPSPSVPARTARPAMSGPPRPLITKSSQARAGPSSSRAPSSTLPPVASTNPSAAPRPPSPSRSVRSVRSTRSTKTTGSATAPQTRTAPLAPPPVPSNPTARVRAAAPAPSSAVAGPSRATLRPVPVKPTPASQTTQGPTDRLRTASTATTSSVRSRVSAINQASSVVHTPPKVPAPHKSVSRLDPSAAAARLRTTSASTAASVQSKASVASTSTARSVAPSSVSTAARSIVSSIASTARTSSTQTPPTPRAASKAATPRTIRTAASSVSLSKQLTPRAAASSPTKIIKPSAPLASRGRNAPATSTATAPKPLPPSAMPSVLSPMRSTSSSTDDTYNLVTPRTVDMDLATPLPSPPLSQKFPPISMTRTARKVSSSSTRSASSTLRHHPASAFDPPPRPLTPPNPQRAQITDGSTPFAGWGVSLHIGIPCIVLLEKKRARFRAQVRYIGHMQGASGVWVGIEAEDLDERFDIRTLPSGASEGVHYFHLTPPEDVPDLDGKASRSRHIDRIRDSLGPKAQSKLVGLGLGLPAPPTASRGVINGLLGVPTPADRGGGNKRSMSPFVGEWLPFERPRALFVRPSEVLFVMGAE